MDISYEKAVYFLRGSVLGDMCCEKNKRYSTGYDIANTQSFLHTDYVEMKHEIFSRYFHCGRIGTGKNWGTNKNEDLRISKRFRIYDQRIVEQILDEMYDEKGNRKIPDISLLSRESILFWYLDDGSLIKTRIESTNRWNNNLRINLRSFEDENILKFIEQFKEKTGIEFRTEKMNGKIIRICLGGDKKIEKFLEYLYPLYEMVPKSFYYKFQPKFNKISGREYLVLE